MDRVKIQKAVRMILEAIGEDPRREGLRETPQRVARMYEEVFAGIRKDPAKELVVFTTEEHDEMVILKDIPFHSFCEHHMIPFIGKAHVAYLPQKDKLAGLSKIARMVDTLAKRLQVQERLTSQIADLIMTSLRAKGVLVVIEAEHLCMTMRGVRKPGSLMVTSAVRGQCRRQETRNEALSLIRSSKG